jgi:hypothetical protein
MASFSVVAAAKVAHPLPQRMVHDPIFSFRDSDIACDLSPELAPSPSRMAGAL